MHHGMTISFLLLSLYPVVSSKGQNITLNANTKTVGDQLYISWNVNTRLPYGNESTRIYFQVKYCPLNIIFRQDCTEVNITLCKATYQRLQNTSSKITGERKELADYLRDANPRIPLFEKNSSVNIRGEWNETSSEFICVVDIDECTIAYPIPQTKGQVMIISSVANCVKEKVLLDINQNEVPSKHLNRPKIINLIQTGRTTVIVKWRTCPYDNPDGFEITFFRVNQREVLECGPKLNRDKAYDREWKCDCKFDDLRPYTNYTVNIKSYDLKSQSLAGVKTFRTHEQAPSSPPTFECVVCRESNYDAVNRIVYVRWKLPPALQLNGLVRKTNLKYWERTDGKTKLPKIITFDSMTTNGSLKLSINMEYYVQIRICTLEELCSDYNDPEVIFKPRKTNVTETKASAITEASSESFEILTTVLIVVFSIITLSLGLFTLLYWRKTSCEEKAQSTTRLDDIKLSENIFEGSDCGSKNSGFSRKSSLTSSEYNELPPDIPEKESSDENRSCIHGEQTDQT